MKSLSKAQLRERDALDVKLNETATAVRTAIETFNAAVATAFEEVEKVRDAYNQAVDEANSWKSGLHQEMTDYEGARSDKWRESDAGSAYQAWMDVFEEELSELDIDAPSELDEPDMPEFPLADLPEQPES